MKISTSLLLITAILGTATFARSDSPTPANPPFSISISAPNTTVRAGSDIYIKARLRNTSNRPISAGGVAHSQGVDTGYQYFCRNSATGASQGNKDFESGVLDGVGESPLLKPGESYERLVPVNRACDMAKPGRYVIQLSRSLPGDDRVVKSNTITVTVTNDDSALSEAPPSFELSIGAYSNGRPSETDRPFVVKAGA